MANYKNINHMLAVDGSGVTLTATAILNASDWTQLPDSGLTSDCVAAFAAYRASLRPVRRTHPANPTWPDAPTEEWS